MKKKLFTLLLASVLLAGLAGGLMAQTAATPAQPAPTQAAPATSPQTPAVVGGQRLALLNIQRAIIESNEGKQAAEKLNNQFADKKKQLEAKQQEIDKTTTQLRTQEKTLSDEARNNLNQRLANLQKDYTRSADDAQAEWEQAQGQVINEIGGKMMKVVEEYALKNGYTIVADVSMQQSPFLWWSNSVEITDDIIKLYNATTPAAAPAPAANPPAVKPPTGKKP